MITEAYVHLLFSPFHCVWQHVWLAVVPLEVLKRQCVPCGSFAAYLMTATYFLYFFRQAQKTIYSRRKRFWWNNFFFHLLCGFYGHDGTKLLNGKAQELAVVYLEENRKCRRKDQKIRQEVSKGDDGDYYNEHEKWILGASKWEKNKREDERYSKWVHKLGRKIVLTVAHWNI